MLGDTQLSLLESGLNRALAADPDSAVRLARLAGKTLRIDSWLADEVAVYVTFDADSIRLDRRFDGEVAASISGGALGFLRAAMNPGDRRVFSDGTLAITGDATVVQSFADLFRLYEANWQGRLAPVIGEAATWRVEAMIDHLRTWRRDAAGHLVEDAGDYLREETRLLASRDAVRAFCDDVDAVVADVARLEKRIARLGKRGR